jgi:subtilisin family serine protease
MLTVRHSLCCVASFATMSFALAALLALGGCAGGGATTSGPTKPPDISGLGSVLSELARENEQKQATSPQPAPSGNQSGLDLTLGVPSQSFSLPAAQSVDLSFRVGMVAFEAVGTSGFNKFELDMQQRDTLRGWSTVQGIQGSWINADVRSAWQQGWTGKGIKIGVIDDFTVDDFSDLKNIPLANACETVDGLRLCTNSQNLYIRMTHGEQVVAIAGGGFSSLVGAKFETGIITGLGSFNTYSAVGQVGIDLSYPVFGVAKDATILRNDFLTYQRSTQGLFGEFRRWGVGSDSASRSYRELKVVNLSLGGTSRNPIQNRATFDQQLLLANQSIVPDAIFVKAAGNNACTASNTNCDPINAVFMASPQFKEKTVLVGALDRAGGGIASYSNRAGAYGERFLLAEGTALSLDDTPIVGTSFAAPRVSGYAAIIRQKFPNLSAENTAKVLLDTARWNSGWGPRDAERIAIYGRGEADLGRALAPSGSLR